MTCHATREGDELVCRACRLRWDVKDAERPECRNAPLYHRGGVALPSAPHLVGPGLAGKFAAPIGRCVLPWPDDPRYPAALTEAERFVSGLPDREPRN